METAGKVFPIEKRGYNTAQVDSYIKLLAEEFSKQEQLILKLTAQNEELVAQSEELKNNETAIKEVLLTAHKTSETMIEDAKEDARVIREQAKMESQRIQDEIDSLKKEFDAYIQKLVSYVDDQRTWLLGYDGDTAVKKTAYENEQEISD